MDGAVKAVVQRFLSSADSLLAPGYSAVLYGSAARGDWVEGRSDVNLLVVTEDVSPERLRALGSALRRWRDRSVEPPLLLSRDEWNRAADAFPIEITDMQLRHDLLRGPDPVSGMQVAQGDLRRALEAEFRGKLLRLRQAWATFADAEKDLTPLARRSLSSLLVLWRAMLSLLGHANAASAGGGDVIQAAGVAAGFEPGPLIDMLQHRDERGWRCSATQFQACLDAVARAARHVDQLQTGES